MTTQKTTSTPSRAAIAEQLKLMAARHGFIIEWSLSRTEEIAAVLQHHPTLGLAWGEKMAALLHDAKAALASLEEREP